MKESKRRLKESQTNGTLIQVAHLYYDKNLSQQEIADRLKVSRSLIAQYLLRAKKSGIVQIRIMDPDDSCADLANLLRKASGIRDIVVVPTLRGSPMLALQAVTGAAADFIAGHLRDGNTFGLAWGRTTSAVVDQLKIPHARNVDIVPLMGESGHSGLYSQMNQLVMRAAEHLRATPGFLSLPVVVSSPELRGILLKESGIRDIVEKWNFVDLACVGIGVVPPVPGMIVYLGDKYIPNLLEAGAVGDICGTYFDRNGKIVASGLENRMIAMNVTQMKAVKCMAAVACGEDKAVAVLGAMRTGMISALFIDQNMAERILAEIRTAGTRGK